MVQLFIALSIIALALFVIYASERVIFHRRSAEAANETVWALWAGAANEVTLAVCFIVLAPILCIVSIWRFMRPSSKAASKVAAWLNLTKPVQNRPWWRR